MTSTAKLPKDSKPTKKATTNQEKNDDFDAKLIREAASKSAEKLTNSSVWRDSQNKLVRVVQVSTTCYDCRMIATRSNILLQMVESSLFYTIPVSQFFAILSNNKPRYTRVIDTNTEELEGGKK